MNHYRQIGNTSEMSERVPEAKIRPGSGAGGQRAAYLIEATRCVGASANQEILTKGDVRRHDGDVCRHIVNRHRAVARPGKPVAPVAGVGHVRVDGTGPSGVGNRETAGTSSR